jgi:putrescine transport system ATP-binding protein
MTVAQNIAFGLKQDKMPRGEIDRPRGGNAQAGPYAGVRQTQAAPACPAASASVWPWPAAWPSGRKLLLLDEPMGALDKKLRDRMQLEVTEFLSASA